MPHFMHIDALSKSIFKIDLIQYKLKLRKLQFDEICFKNVYDAMKI